VAKGKSYDSLFRFLADTKGLEKGTKRADRALKGTSKAGQATNAVFGGITKAVGALGIALGGRELLQWAGDAVQMAIAADEVDSKFEAVFGSARKFTESLSAWADMAGITDTASRDLAATFGNLAQSVGIPDDATEELTLSVATLAGDMASFNDDDPAEVFRTLNTAILTAERDGLKKYGISVSENEVKTRALEIAVKDGRVEFTKTDKALASYQLITERAGKANGDLEATQDSLANKQRQVTASVDEMKEAFGKELVKVLATTAKGIDTQTNSLEVLGKAAGTVVRKYLEPYAEALIQTGVALDTSKDAGDRFGAGIGAIDAYIRASIPPIQWLYEGINKTGIAAADAELEMAEFKKGLEETRDAISESSTVAGPYIEHLALIKYGYDGIADSGPDAEKSIDEVRDAAIEAAGGMQAYADQLGRAKLLMEKMLPLYTDFAEAMGAVQAGGSLAGPAGDVATTPSGSGGSGDAMMSLNPVRQAQGYSDLRDIGGRTGG